MQLSRVLIGHGPQLGISLAIYFPSSPSEDSCIISLGNQGSRELGVCLSIVSLGDGLGSNHEPQHWFRHRNLVLMFIFQNLDNAWQWVKGLSTGGSTNTLASLKLALADPQCHAIYLLTDGRPDQVRYYFVLSSSYVLGTLRNYDGHGNGNVKKAIGSMSKTKTQSTLF